MDYAVKSGISLSTLRRHIKSNKVQYKIENGRYLILDAGHGTNVSTFATVQSEMAQSGFLTDSTPTLMSPSETSDSSALAQLAELNTHLSRAQEEIAELKMLVALYEEQLPQHRPSSN